MACPGFGSKVSVCVGPPPIHRTMQDRLRCGSLAAAAARPGRKLHAAAEVKARRVIRRDIRHLND